MEQRVQQLEMKAWRLFAECSTRPQHQPQRPEQEESLPRLHKSTGKQGALSRKTRLTGEGAGGLLTLSKKNKTYAEPSFSRASESTSVLSFVDSPACHTSFCTALPISSSVRVRGTPKYNSRIHY